ncbi:MAG: helix-turn-helix domain-containing protein [Vagococcus fluvialis]
MNIDDVLDNIGVSIREIRKSKGITQQKLADKANLSLPFINLIENNQRRVSLESLLKILEVLEISMSEFFLPYSQDSDDEELTELLVLLQKSPHKEEYIGLFLEMLKLSQGLSQ